MTSRDLRKEWVRRTDEIARRSSERSTIALSIACLARACVSSAMLTRNEGESAALTRLPYDEPKRYLLLRGHERRC